MAAVALPPASSTTAGRTLCTCLLLYAFRL